VLRASRRLLRPGGWLAFHTIYPTPGLSKAAYRRAIKVGPRAVSTRRRDHRELLATAGYVSIEIIDLTGQYRRTILDFLEHHKRLADEDRQADLRGSLSALDEGLLMRSLFLGRRAE